MTLKSDPPSAVDRQVAWWFFSLAHKPALISGAATLIRPGLDGRIVGGRPVYIEDFPYQVKLWFFTSKKYFFNCKLLILLMVHLPKKRCFCPGKHLISNAFRCSLSTVVITYVAVQSSVRTGWWRLLVVLPSELMLPTIKCWKFRLCAIQQNTQWGGNVSCVKCLFYIDVILIPKIIPFIILRISLIFLSS